MEKIEKTINPNIIVDRSLLDYIPIESAEHYQIVPLELKDNNLLVGALDPSNLDARDALNFISISQNITYSIIKIDQQVFDNVIKQYSEAGAAVSDAIEELEQELDVILGIDEEETESSKNFLREEAPVIKLVSNILSQSVEKGSSDIHIEPFPLHSVVRFRIDGELQDILSFPRKVHEPLIARIKILSNLRLDEKRRPQDGRFSSSIKNNRVDFRTATFPTSEGEKIVLRVLDRQRGLRTLGELGLSEDGLDKLLSAVNKPHGLVLATGPTGSGKTTTLYALLNTLEKKTKNIVSLEDPVEYSLEGISQSNIRPEIGYNFATGLRSILRGDPDQILVGEIRDKETAHLAVQAALTGHVVYSTLHTNTSIGAISRLLNFGIEPFLLAPVLSAVVAQRLVRSIEGEGKDIVINSKMRTSLDERFGDLPAVFKNRVPEFNTFKEAVPTDNNPTGLKGRTGVYEVFSVDADVRSTILSNPSEDEIYKIARKKGMITIEEDAIIKGLQGKIPLTEVAKISSENKLGDLSIEDELPDLGV